MSTFDFYRQAGISFLQIQIAATGVMLVAVCVSQAITRRQVVAREWLWQSALVGVLVSTLVPLFNSIAPSGGPELAILPVAPTASRSRPVEEETEPAPTRPTSSKTLLQSRSDVKETERRSVSPLPSVSKQSDIDHLVATTSLPPVAAPQRTPNDVLVARVTPLGWILRALLLVWLAGVVYHLMRGMIGIFICRRIVAASVPLNEAQYREILLRTRSVLSLAALPPISVTPQIGSPAVIGMFWPQIVLPATALTWMSPAQLFQVLVHESAHVLRRDPVVNFLQVIARALFWHHPLFHWLNHRLSQSREEVCDNFVLAHATPPDYAETLLEMTQKCPRLLPARGLAVLSEAGSFEERVMGLLDGARDLSLRWPLGRKLGMASGMLLVPIFLGLIRVTERPIQADEPKKPVVTKQPLAPVSAPAPAPTTAAAASAEPVANAETGTHRIFGQVKFDKDGRVAPEAKVILLPPPPKGQDAYYGLLPLRETTADSQGRFSFDSLTPGRYRVWANLGKQTSRMIKKGLTLVLKDGNEPPQPVELRLTDGITVVAKVTDKATGALIPNATIHLVWSDLIGDFHAIGNMPVTVQPLTAERWFFEAWADGYAKESRWLNLENREDAATEFQLVPGGTLEGVALDPEARPVEGVGLSVRYEDSPHQIAWIQTDSKGQYRVEHLPYGRGLKIGISKEGWQSQNVSFQLKDPKQKLDLAIVPRPHGGTITGVVQDGAGHPIPNAKLTNLGQSSSQIIETTTDAQGRFKLDNLFRGSVGPEVVVRASKFAPQRFPVVPGPADKPTEMTIKMEPGHRIIGRVTDDAGQALEGVVVYFADGDSLFSSGGQGKTDQSGRFEFDSLPAESPFTFRKQGFSTIDSQVLPLDKADVITVKMMSMGAILGKVTDRATGQAIRSFNVRVTFTSKPEPNDAKTSLLSDWVTPGQTFVSDSGTFKLSNLTAGSALQVMIDAKGYETGFQERVIAARSDQLSEVKFELDAIDPATLRKYRGRLLDARGSPVSAAQLRLIVKRNGKAKEITMPAFRWQMIRSGQIAQQTQILRFLEGTTDQQGFFEFPEIPRNASAELVWWGSQIASGGLDHLEKYEEKMIINITLPATARVIGKLDRKKYPQISRIEVSSDDVNIERIGLDIKPDQQDFEINNLVPGSYHVNLMGPLERLSGTFEGAMTTRRLTSVKVVLEAGDVKTVDWK